CAVGARGAVVVLGADGARGAWGDAGIAGEVADQAPLAVLIGEAWCRQGARGCRAGAEPSLAGAPRRAGAVGDALAGRASAVGPGHIGRGCTGGEGEAQRQEGGSKGHLYKTIEKPRPKGKWQSPMVRGIVARHE